LLGAGERTQAIFAIVAIHDAMKSLPWQKIVELSKESCLCPLTAPTTRWLETDSIRQTQLKSGTTG
jgi:hypothetical protein